MIGETCEGIFKINFLIRWPVAQRRASQNVPNHIMNPGHVVSCSALKPKLHLYGLLWICCTACCTTNRISGVWALAGICAKWNAFLYIPRGDALWCVWTRRVTGSEGEHEATVSTHSWPAVQPLSQAGQVQEAAVLSVLLSLGAHRASQVPDVGLEHRLRLQRLWLWGTESLLRHTPSQPAINCCCGFVVVVVVVVVFVYRCQRTCSASTWTSMMRRRV